MSITRRLFLRSVPPAVAVGTVVAAPVVAEAIETEPKKSPHEQAMWHMRELERLIIEDGAKTSAIIVVGHNYPNTMPKRHRMLLINPTGELLDDDGMFRDAEAVS